MKGMKLMSRAAEVSLEFVPYHLNGAQYVYSATGFPAFRSEIGFHRLELMIKSNSNPSILDLDANVIRKQLGGNSRSSPVGNHSMCEFAPALPFSTCSERCSILGAIRQHQHLQSHVVHLPHPRTFVHEPVSPGYMDLALPGAVSALLTHEDKLAMPPPHPL